MLMGKSGSGKSTLERELVSRYPNLFYKVVSVTTRKQRDGETDGIDYKFITIEQFNDLDTYDELIQITSFAGNCYGSLYKDYLTPHPYTILTVTPNSAASFIPILKNRLDVDVLIVYFNISDEAITSNMVRRGDSAEYIKTRLETDDLEEQFKNSGLKSDFIINDQMLTPDLPDTFVEWLTRG